MVRLDITDAAVNKIVAEMFNIPVMVTAFEPGNDHSAELKKVQYEIGQLAAADLDGDEFGRRMAKLCAERNRLHKLEPEPGQVTETPTGQTYAELWLDTDCADRAAFIREHGFTVSADKEMW